MKYFKISASQRGTALAFSLLILLILTVVGVASMSNTQMQERMAGNFNLQSIAFEAASAGVSQALEVGIDEMFDEDPRCDTADLSSGSTVLPSTSYDDFTPQEVSIIENQNLIVQYRLKAECLDDETFGETNPNRPTQAYVTSKGEVRRRNPTGTSGPVLAEREIEVRLDSFRIDNRSAIHIIGEANVTCCGNQRSRQFRVDGAGGPAISTTTQANAETITTAIGEDRISNYDGGIANSTYDLPFSTAWQLARFALEVRAFIEFHQQKLAAPSPWPSVCREISASEWTSNDTGGFEEVLGTYRPEMNLVDGDFSWGSSTRNGIYYVTGELTMAGNSGGNGLVIVEGPLVWNGTPDYKGVIIALGGSFAISGAGQGETEGSVFIANLDIAGVMQGAYDGLRTDWTTALNNDPNTDWSFVLDRIHHAPDEDVEVPDGGWGNFDENSDTAYEDLYSPASPYTDGFGPTTLTIDGGGTGLVEYDCYRFEDVNIMLSACGQGGTPVNDFQYNGLADPWISVPDYCDTPGQGATLQAIQSWRENLGWRELLSDT